MRDISTIVPTVIPVRVSLSGRLGGFVTWLLFAAIVVGWFGTTGLLSGLTLWAILSIQNSGWSFWPIFALMLVVVLLSNLLRGGKPEATEPDNKE